MPLMGTSRQRYPISFWNARVTNGRMRGVCHFSTKLVAMATSLEIPDEGLAVASIAQYVVEMTPPRDDNAR